MKAKAILAGLAILLVLFAAASTKAPEPTPEPIWCYYDTIAYNPYHNRSLPSPIMVEIEGNNRVLYTHCTTATTSR